MRNFKIIASVVLMIALLLSISIFASADPLSAAAFGGLFSSFLNASGVAISSSGLSADAYNQYFLSETNTDEDWLSPLSDYRVYFNRDSSTGTDHIWIGGSSVLDEFETKASDFITDKNISSYSSDSLLSSTYQFAGYPFDSSYSYYRSVPFSTVSFPATASVGDRILAGGSGASVVCTCTQKVGNTYLWDYEVSFNGDGVYHSASANRTSQTYFLSLVCYPNDSYNVYIQFYSRSVGPSPSQRGNSLGVATLNNSSIDYSAGSIDTSISSGQGLDIIIPSNTSYSFPDGYLSLWEDIQALSVEINEALSADTLVSSSFSDAPVVPPVPPTPTPYPSDSLGAIPYDTWMADYGTDVTDTLGLIDQDINDVNDTIGLVGEDIVDVIDTYGQSAIEAIDNQTDVIDTYGQSVVDSLDNIDQGINAPLIGVKAKLDSLVDSLADVGTNVLEAVKEEILGDIAKLETVFAGVITRLRNAMSIWHYVVEWIGSIGSVFGWIIGFASNTSYYMVLPIYACIAGGIVLGVYRRFGR